MMFQQHDAQITQRSLDAFITELNKEVMALNLEIVNGPKTRDPQYLRQAQNEIREQEEKLLKWGKLCSTPKGLVHFIIPESELPRLLTIEEVREYYKQRADMGMLRKKCTCDGLSAITFELARRMLAQYPNNITVEICPLSNWSHSLLHLSQKNNNKTENLFYDPWAQQCYTTTPKVPKVFPDGQLGIEMQKLFRQSHMIEPTEILYDLEDNCKQVINTRRDYAYFVACSTEEFTNPAPQVADPSVVARSWFSCNLL